MSISVDESDEIILKIIILGDSSVGKTSLILKYVDSFYGNIYVATIGVEYKMKKISLNGININLQIWDTAGQERYRGLTRNFLKGADGIIYVFDITNKETFDNLKIWIDMAEQTTADYKQIIIGNKIDLEEERQVPEEVFHQFCQSRNIEGMEVSCKENVNIKKCFERLAQLIIEGKTNEELLQNYSERGRNRGRSYIVKENHRKKVNKCKC